MSVYLCISYYKQSITVGYNCSNDCNIVHLFSLLNPYEVLFITSAFINGSYMICAGNWVIFSRAVKSWSSKEQLLSAVNGYGDDSLWRGRCNFVTFNNRKSKKRQFSPAKLLAFNDNTSLYFTPLCKTLSLATGAAKDTDNVMMKNTLKLAFTSSFFFNLFLYFLHSRMYAYGDDIAENTQDISNEHEIA